MSLPAVLYPSCLHVTVASTDIHRSSQTVPHSLFQHISTLPSKLVLPPISLTSPLLHPVTIAASLQFSPALCHVPTLTYGAVDATHTSIFSMDTVVDTNSSVRTIEQEKFSAEAPHIIQKDTAWTLTESSKAESHSSYIQIEPVRSTCDYIQVFIPVAENPSCLQTTAASMLLHASSHTVPQALLLQTSTRPSLALEPPARRISPVVHPTCAKQNET